MRSDQFLSSRLHIGAVPTSGRAFLAPMSGISDVAFRRIAARFGAGLVVTEMVASNAYIADADEARIRAEGSGISPHVVQLVGRSPRAMAEAARLAEANGADVVDINLGCPAKKVTGGLCGSALMREPDLALGIVAAVVGAVTIPVSVKMRLGWDDAQRNAAALARDAVACGAQAITVHGRTRQQFYTGKADWPAIAEVVDALGVPVVANGDVVDSGSAALCLEHSRASAVMIGRAALGQPWLIGEVSAALAGVPYRSPSPAERSAASIEHYEAMLSLYGVAMGLRHARKHLAAYCDRASEQGFGLDGHDRQILVTATDPGIVLGLLGRIYDAPRRLAA